MSARTDATRPASEQEPFIPYAKPEQVPPSLQQVLARYTGRMGFLPNALRFYLHRPEIAAALWNLNDAVMRDPTSVLDQFLKRKLAALASKLNGCKYCTTHHCEILQSPGGFGVEGWDMPDAELCALLTGEPSAANEMEQVCFDFVVAASSAPTEMPDGFYERLRRNLTPAQIVELSALVGFWKMYNTMHDALRIPIEQHLLDRSRTVGIA